MRIIQAVAGLQILVLQLLTLLLLLCFTVVEDALLFQLTTRVTVPCL